MVNASWACPTLIRWGDAQAGSGDICFRESLVYDPEWRCNIFGIAALHLFSDARLSHDNRYSCATCHPLHRGGMDGLPVAISPTGGRHLRNTLTVFNVGLSATYNWDSVTDTLEHHTEPVLANPDLMNIRW